jgi:hypothetical protein
MSEEKKPSENNVTYWAPPLPWFAPLPPAMKKDEEVIIEELKEEKIETKD